MGIAPTSAVGAVYDRAFGPLASESCAVIDRAYRKSLQKFKIKPCPVTGQGLIFLQRTLEVQSKLRLELAAQVGLRSCSCNQAEGRLVNIHQRTV